MKDKDKSFFIDYPPVDGINLINQNQDYQLRANKYFFPHTTTGKKQFLLNAKVNQTSSTQVKDLPGNRIEIELTHMHLINSLHSTAKFL